MKHFQRHTLALLVDILLLVACLAHLGPLRDKARFPFDIRLEDEKIVVDRIVDLHACRTLAPGDNLTSVESSPLTSNHDCDFVVERHSIGDRVTLAGVRNDAPLRWEVLFIPEYSLSYIMIAFGVGFLTIAIGVFVLLSRPSDRAARVLHWAMTCMGVSTMLAWGKLSGTPFEGLVNRSAFFATYMGVGVFMLHFALLFPRERWHLSAVRGALIYVPAVAMSLALIAFHWVAFSTGSSHLYGLFRTLYDAFHVLLLMYVGLSVVLVVHAYVRTHDTIERKKLQWILFGICVGPMPFLLLVVLPELFIPVSPVPEEVTIAFFIFIPLSFAVAVIRYHALDIEVVLNRATVYGVAIGVLMLAYVGMISAIATAFAAFSVPAAAGGAALLAFVFEPFRRKVQTVVDRKFFRARYNFRKAERTLLEKIVHAHSSQELSRLLVDELQQLIPSDGICVLLKDHAGGVQNAASVAAEATASFCTEADLGEFTALEGPVAWPGTCEVDVPNVPAVLAAKDKVALIVPMNGGEAMNVGWLVFGPKRSGGRFTDEDLDLLSNVADRAGSVVMGIRLQHDLVIREIEADHLKALSALKSHLVSTVSHEFRTPLTSIKMFTELLEPVVPKRSERGREYLRVIAGETDRLNRMVENLLDTARIEHGAREYTLRAVDARKIVREVVSSLRYQLDKEGFVLRMKVPHTPVPLTADPDAVYRAIENLLTNAMKYSGSSRTIDVSMIVEAASTSITVRDHGIGITPEQRRHLFTSYYRAATLQKSIRGIGLGLALVKHIMAAHSGDVLVRSTPGEGSEFTLVFPKTIGREAP